MQTPPARRASTPPRTPRPPLLALQAAAGNQAVARLVDGGTSSRAVQREGDERAGSAAGSGTVSVHYGPVSVTEGLLEEHRGSVVPIRFDPQLGEAVAAARAALPAAGLALKTVETLTAARVEVAEARMATIAAETGIPEESLGFLTRYGLRVGTAKAVELLSAVTKIRQLGDEEQQAEWARIQAEFGLLGDLRVGAAFGEIAVAVTGAAITVVGAAAGAVWGAGGKGAVAGMVAVLGSQGAKVAGKLLAGAGAVFEIVRGAAQMATAKSDAEFVSGAFGVGSGAGTLTGIAAGAGAVTTLGAGLLGGGYLALAAWTLSKTDDVAAGFTALELHRQSDALGRLGTTVARHATWTKSTLDAYGEAVLLGDATIERELRAHYITAAQHLAYSLYQLLGPRRGPVGHAVRAHLLSAVGGQRAVPTAQTVRFVRMGMSSEADEMVRVATRAVAALEEVFYDPRVRATIIESATREAYENR